MDNTLAKTHPVDPLPTELEKLEQAISKLQNGERISSVSYDGHSISYAGITLAELLQQRQRLLSKIAEKNKHTKRQVIFATHKGVRS